MARDQIDPSDVRRWRRGFVLWGSVATVVALAAGWTLLWLVVSWSAQARVDDWLRREAGRGRSWACPDRRIEGFPASLRIVCENPTFSGALDGVGVRARVTRLSAGAFLLRPSQVEVEFGGPLALAMPDDDADLKLAFSRLRLDLRISFEKLANAALLGDGLEIRWNGPGGSVDGAARSLEFSAQSVDDVEATYDFAVNAAGLVFPALDAFTDSQDPATLSANARLSGVVLSEARSRAERLERWRSAGGRLLLHRLIFDKGALRLTASAELGLDDAHRLTGRADVGETGADALLLRLGAPPAALGAANMLGRLLRGSESGRPAVELPVAFKDGRVAIGPLRNVASLKPFY